MDADLDENGTAPEVNSAHDGASNDGGFVTQIF
jgi:hypothetical protein